MKYKLITLMLGVLLISVAVAGIGGVITDNKTTPRNNFTTAEINKLEVLGIDEFNYEDSIKENRAYRKLISNNEFNLPEIYVDTTYQSCTNFNENISICLEYETLDYTEEEIDNLLDAKMVAVQKNIANTFIERDARTSTSVREGIVKMEVNK